MDNGQWIMDNYIAVPAMTATPRKLSARSSPGWAYRIDN